ncbi:diguanylate cyclase [Salinisphaera sp. SPP-AMP-43]|uniref:GGDEF domain-containing protein n=1 Tax=Salinisphaera sp. SPP-AMP-43 TaxID=3121288 RepID=UPI003C6E6B2A
MDLVMDARRTSAHAAFWLMTRRVTVLAACVDVVFFLFFLWSGPVYLAWINVLSVSLYVLANLLLRYRYNYLALLLIWIEVMGHAVIGTLAVGWGAGFHYYLLMFIPAIMVSGYLALTLLPLCVLFTLYVGLYLVATRAGPLSPIADHALVALNLFNVLVFFMMASYTARFFYQRVRQSEQRLREYAARDTLTGLYNRRYFLELAGKEQSRAERESSPLAVVIADIDYFKNINDTFGHEAGDQVLVHIGAILDRCCRAGDAVARWGGEEFLFLLPNTEASEAEQFAERVCRTVAQQPLRRAAQDSVLCTLSLGVAAVGMDKTFADALAEADRALYESKMAGRNRVTTTGPVVADSYLAERRSPA